MTRMVFALCATIVAITGIIPDAQASGCMTRPDGTRQCSANGSSADFGGRKKTSPDFPAKPYDRMGMSGRGEGGYRLPPFGGRQTGITCYNFIGKPYTYKGGGRCPIS